jgi:hypothetical protein
MYTTVVKRATRERIQTNGKHLAVETSAISGNKYDHVLTCIPAELASAFFRRLMSDS